jgi:superfamily II DNA or RNA helicase
MRKAPPIDTSGSKGREIRLVEVAPVQQNLHSDDPNVAAILDPALCVGAHVRARGDVWGVRAVDPYRACQVVALTSLTDSWEPGAARTLLVPFDRIAAVRRSCRWRACGLGRATASISRVIQDAVAGGAGRLLRPDVALVPWQWTAAAALVRGDASVLLLADAVGLGKTVQAALAIAALRGRNDAMRVLILTPAGLRDQWHAEVERLFRFSCTVVDAASLRAARRTMPADVNPWSVASTVIASIDFVKQPEVLAAATGAPWDVLIVDEAHTLGARSDRRVAAAALSACARHVLLITATPHAGSDEEFKALCNLGSLAGDEAETLVIRRTRADVGLNAMRRVRVAHVALTEAERHMHTLLREYAGAVWQERGTHSSTARLAMAVLLKRAASSAWALARSVAHRLRLLGTDEDSPAQPDLPFDDSGDTDDADAEVPGALAEPGLDERGRELHLLARLAEAARIALSHDSKLERVATLLRRIDEPAIVFTEYRDTLHAAIRAFGGSRELAVLHGGLSRVERRDAERSFTAGSARVLLATDVASEGLNLHGRCRLVVNLELPWSPVRLEQRIGRVDRIGQRRRVHAVHMVGRDTTESYVLRRLAARARHARRALGDTYEDNGLTDALLAADALGVAAPEHQDISPVRPLFRPSAQTAHHEHRICALLNGARRLARGTDSTAVHARLDEYLPIAIVRPRVRERLALTPGVVVGFRIEVLTAAGRRAASALIPIHVALASSAPSRAHPSTLIAALLPLAREAALREGPHLLARDLDGHRRYTARASARESALSAAAGGDTGAPGPAVQPGLFDRRAVHEAARQRGAREHRVRLHAARLSQLALDARVESGLQAEPIMALVLR